MLKVTPAMHATDSVWAPRRGVGVAPGLGGEANARNPLS
jgi:hypothetical protein